MNDDRSEMEIVEFTSTVRPVDGGALLAPGTLRRIAEAVIEILDARDRHRERVCAERRVTAGVATDRDGEEA
jgi:hypothetical protein